MKYISTRGNYQPVEASRAILQGMVPTGGLFVPEEIPALSNKEIIKMQNKTYQEIAFNILNRFLTDYRQQEIEDIISRAYNPDNFKHPQIAPLKKLNERIFILELWHGPTAAFKDMALQLMPHLLVAALKKQKTDKEIVILVATSGDTGKAALEGFKDVPGVKIIVFYPAGGVSKIQELQMLTTEGENTSVIGVEGNFDNCQNAVKEAFADVEFNNQLAKEGFRLSSANSINWGRLLPQIIYYFKAYAALLGGNEIKEGETINITVPTGNFGNILSAYYAYRMGLPVNRFICASNDNKILTDFIKTGEYNINRQFKKTISPSMDILISSNLERFLFEITGRDSQKINEWYQSLKSSGSFRIGADTTAAIKELFSAEFASQAETRQAIKEVFDKYHYTIDTHTAVGVKVYQKYYQQTADDKTTIIDATANPYKFSRAVFSALGEKVAEKDEFEILAQMQKKLNIPVHPGLQGLQQKEIRHRRVCAASEIKNEVAEILGVSGK